MGKRWCWFFGVTLDYGMRGPIQNGRLPRQAHSPPFHATLLAPLCQGGWWRWYAPASCLYKYWCPVNLYERPQKRRVLGKRIEGVASERDAVEEKSPAVDESSHGGLFLRRATPPKIDAT